MSAAASTTDQSGPGYKPRLTIITTLDLRIKSPQVHFLTPETPARSFADGPPWLNRQNTHSDGGPGGHAMVRPGIRPGAVPLTSQSKTCSEAPLSRRANARISRPSNPTPSSLTHTHLPSHLHFLHRPPSHLTPQTSTLRPTHAPTSPPAPTTYRLLAHLHKVCKAVRRVCRNCGSPRTRELAISQPGGSHYRHSA